LTGLYFLLLSLPRLLLPPLPLPLLLLLPLLPLFPLSLCF
jgi:hypothetical protein